MIRSRRLRIGYWVLVALFAAWAVVSLSDYDPKWRDWQSPVTGSLAALVAIIGAVIGLRGRTAFRFLIPALLITGSLAVWIRSENLKRADYLVGVGGVVVGPVGEPISGANITITFAKNVFQAIDPVRTVRTSTESRGSFDVAYISCGDPNVAFELTVNKVGYYSASIRGEGLAKRRIVLQKSS